MKKYLTIVISSLAVLSGCTEDINLTVVGSDSKIVIEGSIENGTTAQVMITRTSSLSQAVDFANILVTDAKVYVSNGIITDTLHLDTLLTTSIPFVYVGSKVVGTVGQSYHLTVIADGKTYTSTTVIPTPVALDSVWWQPQPPEDTLGYAWAFLSEPIGTGNAYRWFAKTPTRASFSNNIVSVRNRRYIAPLGATFDDKLIDGKQFKFAYNKGVDATEASFNDSEENWRGYYKNTDTIYIKFCAVDSKVSEFYTTYETALQSSGNPFASPVTILSNIDGGGVGIWAGYGATYDTIMPKP
jgi:hypothetical protein